MNKSFTDLLERAQSWPEYAREQLEEVALEIEAELAKGTYRATPEELAGIERGLCAVAEGRLATDEEVEAVFAKYPGA
jgi:predicted transcriptional regulator